MSNRLRFAIDEANRWKDTDGRLHVRWTNISKATVNPYYGREIPGFEKLGLDANRIYQLWRHPEELAKAAPTFNGIQLMSTHIGVSAADPKEEQVAGALGNDAEFRPPYLGNSMTIWRAEDIAYVESGKKCQLSCGYYYDPDMAPGEIQGLRYDGVMRNIRANHVALVEAGRAGPDVIVADERLVPMPTAPLTSRKALMVKGALAAYLRPKLVPGTNIALDAALSSVTRLNWQTEKAKLLAAVTELATPILAKDAKLDDLPLALDWMDKEEDGEAEDDDLEAEDEEEEDDDKEKRMAMEKKAKDAKRAKDKKARDAKRAQDLKAKDAKKEDDEEEEEEDDEEEEAKDRRAKDRKAKDKKAMDAAIETATAGVISRMNAAMEAREVVRPIVGNVALALDSAEAIYKFALDTAKIKTAGIPPAAYKAMVGMLPRPGQSTRTLAFDQAAGDTLETRFPALARITQS